MEQEELEIQEPCADCGTVIIEGLSRSFRFGEGLLCWECAIRRGGKFDAERDTWSVEPKTADLPERREW